MSHRKLAAAGNRCFRLERQNSHPRRQLGVRVFCKPSLICGRLSTCFFGQHPLLAASSISVRCRAEARARRAARRTRRAQDLRATPDAFVGVIDGHESFDELGRRIEDDRESQLCFSCIPASADEVRKHPDDKTRGILIAARWAAGRPSFSREYLAWGARWTFPKPAVMLLGFLVCRFGSSFGIRARCNLFSCIACRLYWLSPPFAGLALVIKQLRSNSGREEHRRRALTRAIIRCADLRRSITWATALPPVVVLCWLGRLAGFSYFEQAGLMLQRGTDARSARHHGRDDLQ